MTEDIEPILKELIDALETTKRKAERVSPSYRGKHSEYWPDKIREKKSKQYWFDKMMKAKNLGHLESEEFCRIMHRGRGLLHDILLLDGSTSKPQNRQHVVKIDNRFMEMISDIEDVLGELYRYAKEKMGKKNERQ